VSELKLSLRIEKITNPAAKRLLDRHHPLGAGQAFAFALGVFWQGRCEGVLTFGNPICNNAVKRFGLRQCDVLELRKLWMSDKPPKNSESRVLAIAARIIRKTYPQLQLLLTYCGGEEAAAAYKASGWIPLEAHQYVREIRVGSTWYSVRDANRKRILGLAEEKKSESRRKYVLPLNQQTTELIKSASLTSKRPRRPETGTCSIGRGLVSTQANSPDSSVQQAAPSSRRVPGRTSTRSTTATATPNGSDG
jgi:hypothetical protein